MLHWLLDPVSTGDIKQFANRKLFSLSLNNNKKNLQTTYTKRITGKRWFQRCKRNEPVYTWEPWKKVGKVEKKDTSKEGEEEYEEDGKDEEAEGYLVGTL